MSARDGHLDDAEARYEEAIVELNRCLGSLEEARESLDKAGETEIRVPAAHRQMNALKASRVQLHLSLRAIRGIERQS